MVGVAIVLRGCSVLRLLLWSISRLLLLLVRRCRRPALVVGGVGDAGGWRGLLGVLLLLLLKKSLLLQLLRGGERGGGRCFDGSWLLLRVALVSISLGGREPRGRLRLHDQKSPMDLKLEASRFHCSRLLYGAGSDEGSKGPPRE